MTLGNEAYNKIQSKSSLFRCIKFQAKPKLREDESTAGIQRRLENAIEEQFQLIRYQNEVKCTHLTV